MAPRPSLQSLVIQSLALLMTAGLVLLLQNSFLAFSYQPALWQFVLVQGAIAAFLSRLWRQPAWWPPLHLGFFPAILLALQAGVPAWVYLAVFLLLVLFYWSTFRTRVPLYLSNRRARQAVASLLPASQAFRFIDLGSGLGGVPFYLAPRFPQGRFCGTETAPAPWLISCLRAWLRHSPVTFMRRDYATLDLADFDVVFAFLSPAAMPALWKQAEAQMRRGSLFVSLSFAVSDRQPDHLVAMATGVRHTLYGWRM